MEAATNEKKQNKLAWLLALLVIVLLSGVNGILWYELSRSQSTLTNLMDAVKKQQNSFMAFDRELTKIAQTSQAWAETENKQGAARFDEVLIKEAESLVRLAEARMILLQDKDLAISLLRLADQRLMNVTTKSTQATRAEIAKDIENITALHLPDEAAIFHRLSAIENVIQTMEMDPLKREALPTLQLSNTPKQSFWERLASLVTIQRHEAKIPTPVHSDIGEGFKRSVLIDLGTAKLALMYMNDSLYHEALSNAQAILTTIPFKQNILAPLEKEMGALNEIVLKRTSISFHSIASLTKEGA